MVGHTFPCLCDCARVCKIRGVESVGMSEGEKAPQKGFVRCWLEGWARELGLPVVALQLCSCVTLKGQLHPFGPQLYN